MRLGWLNNGFICKELYAPFILDSDIDYKDSLRQKLLLVKEQAEKAGADSESIRIIQYYKEKILEALNAYYKADLSKCHAIIRNLIKDVGDNRFAASKLNDSYAFPGDRNVELQFFRSRLGNPASSFLAKDMLHLPKKLRAKTGNYRFSIPGNPCLYLSNSSYGCWIETGFPPENDFNVAPVVLDGEQKILNLAVSIRDYHALNELEEERVHCWLKLLMLSITTSYRIKENDRSFKSEYVISQSIMMACKKLGYDGVAYFSKRVSDEKFAYCAINLALFVNYEKEENEYSEIIKHMKMDDAFNYAVYKQLNQSLNYGSYTLRTTRSGHINNIGNFDRQYPYTETEFFLFDMFLFKTWCDKPKNRGKNEIPWGIMTE